MRFMDAYREAVDWMYSDPKAVEMYSKKLNQPIALLKELMDKFHPKATMQTDKFADLDGAIADAVRVEISRQAADPGAGDRAVAGPAAQEISPRQAS